MTIPRVIMHNSVSLDGSFTDFEVNMALHYQLAGEYKADTTLVGSDTFKQGIELYGGEIPAEEDADYHKPNKENNLPYWVIPDTRGILKGLLHYCRRFEFCRDVILLTSGRTPQDYLDYLTEREYDYLVCGDEHADLKYALEALNEKYGTETVLSDAGPTLNGVLLRNGLVDEISLLITPYLVGRKSGKLLSQLNLEFNSIELDMIECKPFDGRYVHLRYKVVELPEITLSTI